MLCSLNELIIQAVLHLLWVQGVAFIERICFDEWWVHSANTAFWNVRLSDWHATMLVIIVEWNCTVKTSMSTKLTNHFFFKLHLQTGQVDFKVSQNMKNCVCEQAIINWYIWARNQRSMQNLKLVTSIIIYTHYDKNVKICIDRWFLAEMIPFLMTTIITLRSTQYQAKVKIVDIYLSSRTVSFQWETVVL